MSQFPRAYEKQACIIRWIEYFSHERAVGIPAYTLQVISAYLAAVGKQTVDGGVQTAHLFRCCLRTPARPGRFELPQDIGFARYRTVQSGRRLQEKAVGGVPGVDLYARIVCAKLQA